MILETNPRESRAEQRTIMSILKIIAQRRSIGKMTTAVPTRTQLECLLEAATHAPNHHNAQPWRFFVLTGKARTELGEVIIESLLTRMENVDNASGETLLERERGKLLRAPVIIVAAAEYPHHSDELEIENVEAVSAAVQNMLLAAEELGLAAMWRTGKAAYDTRVKHWLGLASQDHIVAFLYIGYPAIQRSERHPIPFHHKTTWLGE